jgi:hypothetical protein
VFRIEAGDDFQVWGVVILLIRTFENLQGGSNFFILHYSFFI